MIYIMRFALITLYMLGMSILASAHIAAPYEIAAAELMKGYQFEFCGVRIPVEHPEVRARLKSELARRLRYQQESRELIRRSGRYQQIFQNIIQQYGIPDDFFYIALAESNLSNAVSYKGAVGFWQFMPETAREFGLEVSETVDERVHPERSTHAASRYFKQSYRTFKNWLLVATSYNMGITGLLRCIREQNTQNLFEMDLSEEAQNYIYRVVSFKHLLEYPEKYGISRSLRNDYAPIPCKVVSIESNIPDLESFAFEQETSLTDIKVLNPWLVGNKLIAKPGKTYHIRIPLRDDYMAEELVTESMRKLFASDRRVLADGHRIIYSGL